VYTVCSEYRALVLNEEQAVTIYPNATASSVSGEVLWKKLWKIRVVPRVCTFWWRVLKGFMPDYVTLSRHHTRDDITCRIYKTIAEDLMHALVGCSHAKLFWEAAKELLNLKLAHLHQKTWAKYNVCESSIP
jgi:hypothetical protein